MWISTATALEVITPPDVSNSVLAEGKEPHPYIVYKLSSGVYTKSALIFDGFQDYRLSLNDNPEIEFAAAGPGQPHIMTVSNGDGRGRGKVTEAEIRLNGVLIAGPDRINQQMRALHIPVAVAAHNTLSVTVTGSASSSLYVGIGPENPPRMSIDPAAASLRPGDRQQFTPRFANTDNKTITWSVEAAPGSSVSKAGSIDETGLYTAPDSIPQAGTVIVSASRNADVANTATATITLIPTVGVRVTPAAAAVAASEMQQFAAIVTGAADTSVSWSIYPHLGFINIEDSTVAPGRGDPPGALPVGLLAVVPPPVTARELPAPRRGDFDLITLFSCYFPAVPGSQMVASMVRSFIGAVVQ